MPDEQSKLTRCEIADLYFWLGKDAEIVGFTPWQTVWLAYPTPIIGASDGRRYRINDSGFWEHADGPGCCGEDKQRAALPRAKLG